MPVVDDLELEVRTYEAHRARLLAEELDKYVLIHGDQIIGTYETERDALNDGYRHFGLGPFFVRRISTVDDRVS